MTRAAGCVQEFADLRRDGDQLVAAPQDLDLGLAQDAEARIGDRLKRDLLGAAHEFIFAHAEEGEVVVEQPLQEGDRFGQLVDRDGRRVLLIGADRLAHALLHGPKVEHGDPHVGEHGFEIFLQRLRLLGRDARQMEMQEAFADRLRVGAGLGVEPGELARAVAFHREHGMKGETHVMTTLGQEADG